MNHQLNLLEHEIIEAIFKCSEKNSINKKLYKQYKSIAVMDRVYTKVGFFTKFQLCERELKIARNINVQLGGIHAEIKGLKYGAGFILFVEDGVINTLEGYSYNERWPADARINKIFQVQKDGSIIPL